MDNKDQRWRNNEALFGFHVNGLSSKGRSDFKRRRNHSSNSGFAARYFQSTDNGYSRERNLG